MCDLGIVWVRLVPPGAPWVSLGSLWFVWKRLWRRWVRLRSSGLFGCTPADAGFVRDGVVHMDAL